LEFTFFVLFFTFPHREKTQWRFSYICVVTVYFKSKRLFRLSTYILKLSSIHILGTLSYISINNRTLIGIERWQAKWFHLFRLYLPKYFTEFSIVLMLQQYCFLFVKYVGNSTFLQIHTTDMIWIFTWYQNLNFIVFVDW
jgi:hypothetical protein